MKNEVAETVLVTGVFDVLHAEHLAFLQKARQLGEKLVIGIESDVRVRQLKGEGRPVNPQDQRRAALEQLAVADEVFILPEQFSKPEDHLKVLQQYQPTILAVSSHTAHLDKKQALMAQVGGRVVVVHEHNPVVSTTQHLNAT